MSINRFIVSVPDFSVYKKISKNLKNRGIKKNKIMKYFFSSNYLYRFKPFNRIPLRF